MKGECSPLNFNLIFFPQSINTPGNEIAPGSDIVGKNLQCCKFGHTPPQGCSFASGDRNSLSLGERKGRGDNHKHLPSLKERIREFTRCVNGNDDFIFDSALTRTGDILIFRR